jgi:hypothetical protein
MDQVWGALRGFRVGTRKLEVLSFCRGDALSMQLRKEGAWRQYQRGSLFRKIAVHGYHFFVLHTKVHISRNQCPTPPANHCARAGSPG